MEHASTLHGAKEWVIFGRSVRSGGERLGYIRAEKSVTLD